jgi:hypothetical protein
MYTLTPLRTKPAASLTPGVPRQLEGVGQGGGGAVIRPLFSVSCDSFATTRRTADQGAPEGAPIKGCKPDGGCEGENRFSPV